MKLQLLESVFNLLDKVKTETGKEVLIFENKNMASMVEAKTARANDKNHLIAYSNKYTPEINHIIATKLIQILRIYKVKQEDRKMAIAYKTHLNSAKMSIALEVPNKPHLEMALNNNELTSTWTLSLINQLISQPVSINIEKQIYNEFADLREYQSNIVRAQFKDFNLTLSQQVENLSPSIIYNSSAIMNFVYLKSMDDLTGSNYIDQLNYIVKKHKSIQLYEYTKNNLENNFTSDVNIINYWADFLNISSWFKWIDFEDSLEDGSNA